MSLKHGFVNVVHVVNLFGNPWRVCETTQETKNMNNMNKTRVLIGQRLRGGAKRIA